jgi:two-component system, LytTR family, sensor kinase
MRNISKSVFYEVVIYTFIWLLILAQQVYELTQFSMSGYERFLQISFRYIPIFCLFIVNSAWLVPKFLFGKKTGLYVILAIGFCVGFTIIENLDHLTHILPKDGDFGPPSFHSFDDFGPERQPHHDLFGFGFFNKLVLGLLVISLNTAIRVTMKWYNDEQTRREAEKEYLRSELTFLQNQISPHFFMNTLNNIHALIDINGKDAQLSIVKLSKMMRYLLYESNPDHATLKKEIEFLESYVDLMRLRIDEMVDIRFSVAVRQDHVKLPPLLLIPFIENAFKHGISYQKKSFIHIIIEESDQMIVLTCSNSVFNRKKFQDPDSGIGLKNVTKRLDLLFGDSYQLIIDNQENEFKVKLTLPIHEN